MKRSSKQFKTLLGLALIGMMMIAAAGCDSGDSSDSSSAATDPTDPTDSDVLTGVFVDSPVKGLYYETATQQNYTDEAGRFRYKANETIRFSLGAAAFGEAQAKPYMTPMDLVVGAQDVDDPAVTNMGRFMQGLDEDGDPENGIQIPAEAEEALANAAINFNAPVDDFEADENVQGVFNNLGSGGLRGVEAARQHLREHAPAGWDGKWRPGMDLNDDFTAEAFPMFIDDNENGVCDYFEEGTHDPGGLGAHAFIDENEDGICDLAQNGSNTWHGPGFVDEDEDGVCDYWDNDALRFNRNVGMGFIDEDGDGINDYFQAGTYGYNHDFIDENGDGVCDYAQDGSNTWHGPGFVDEDEDGICDHWDVVETENGEPQYGRGHGHHRRPTT